MRSELLRAERLEETAVPDLLVLRDRAAEVRKDLVAERVKALVRGYGFTLDELVRTTRNSGARHLSAANPEAFRTGYFFGLTTAMAEEAMRNMSPDELRELIAEIELLIHRKYAEARAAVKVIARDAGLPLRALAS